MRSASSGGALLGALLGALDRSLAGAHHLDGTEFGLRRLIPGHAHPWIRSGGSSAHPLLFGLLPALHSTRMSLSSAMKGGQSSQAGRSLHSHARKWIVGSQVALSLVLLVAAGLC